VAGAGPRLGAAFIDRDTAVIDSLLVRPFRTEPFLPGQNLPPPLGRTLPLILGQRVDDESDKHQRDDRRPKLKPHKSLAHYHFP